MADTPSKEEREHLALAIDPNALELYAYPFPLNAADRVWAAGYRLVEPDDPRAEEEILYWKTRFHEAVEELKGTHVNVYKYTIGLPPSPYERESSVVAVARYEAWHEGYAARIDGRKVTDGPANPHAPSRARRNVE